MKPTSLPPKIPKALTGISGFDDSTFGGLPRGRPTLVCGGAGSGKTLFALQFLLNGALRFKEPGVFVSFEEPVDELVTNVASIGYDVAKLVRQKRICIEHVHLERGEIVETGSFNLDGLFIRLEHAVDQIGAKRIVLDTIEVLFASLTDQGLIRDELRRLFRWLKHKGLTAVITGEKGDGGLTRYGIEEYVSDCVIALDNRTHDQISTRRLRIVKYRGSAHATNEVPFLIGPDGFSVLPVASIGLTDRASTKRVSTGVADLDTMLNGKGFLRGTSVLLSGTAGTGKSSIAAAFAAAACQRGERCLLFAFEESAAQIVRNMRSVGNDLQPWLDDGRLMIKAARSTSFGLELHLVEIINAIIHFAPQVVVIDPISNFIASGTPLDVKAMLSRVIDVMKSRDITCVFTSLTFGGADLEGTEIHVSSLMDTWVLLRSSEVQAERIRTVTVLKARGMPHSNAVREFVFTGNGMHLQPVCRQDGQILVGAAREAAFGTHADHAAKPHHIPTTTSRTALRRRKARS